MVQYDPTVIQKFADRLYTQARLVIFLGAIVGFGVGAVAVSSLGRTGVRVPEVLVGGWIGLAIGIVFALGRAAALRLQAQMALCQAEIEKNTRQAKPASPPPLPKGQ